MAMLKSPHQLRVEEFMFLSEQQVPDKPTDPSLEVRLLRAKLIFEEAMELIACLGIQVIFSRKEDGSIVVSWQEHPLRAFDMIKTVDNCCDLQVVTTGTLSSCGVISLPFQRLIDLANLRKFRPICPACLEYDMVSSGKFWRCPDCSHVEPENYGPTKREDGKLIKGTSFVGPENDIELQLKEFGYATSIRDHV